MVHLCNTKTLLKVLEEYNKDLLSFAQEREEEFIKAAPQLLEVQFPEDAADHLEEVAAPAEQSPLPALRAFGRPPPWQLGH